MRTPTVQEEFWQHEFGVAYTQRNTVPLEARISFFASILDKIKNVQSVCEFGANKGHNLDCFHRLSADYKLTGIELNTEAYQLMQEKPYIEAIHSSLQDFKVERTFDLVFTCGVLIHMNPDDLPLIYQKLADSTERYILINEYFNPSPVAIPYRGHEGQLFKRDFAGEFLDTVGENKFEIVDYGFLWKRVSPAWDDTTWFLMEKI